MDEERQSKSMSFANPNNGYPYAKITNITGTGFDLEYVAYYVRYNALAQTINQWVPAAPASTYVAYTAVGVPGTPLPTAINGDNTLCTSNKTYTLNTNWPATWTNSSNIILQSGQGTNSSVFKATSSASGSAWIEATIPNNCGGGPVIVHKDIQAGPYNTSQINVTGQSGVCPESA